MNKNKIIIGILGTIALAGGIFYTVKNVNLDSKSATIGRGFLEVVSNDFDFGEILMMGGLVRHNFTLKNAGDGPVIIEKILTSCMCTIANIFNASGEKVGPFGMGGAHVANPKIDMKILPGEEITVEAVYDPMAHGPNATGKLVREIFIGTDTNQEISLKFKGNGVKQFSKVNQSSLVFTNKEHDFGVVRQSQGIVETKFEVVNNGNETIFIDSLPTSCECTKAEIDKKEIAIGEKTIIKVLFDANLHPEPEGRFFKTVEIVTNVKPSPILKIYADVDYDLGMDKLKFQEHNEEDEHNEKI